MSSVALKNFRALWSEACKTMWIEIASLRKLETGLRADYGALAPWRDITEWLWAPECKGRLGDTKEALLGAMPGVISYAATIRLVLLAAGFEAYFKQFLADYLSKRPRYFAGGHRTQDGDTLWGEVFRRRGKSERIEEFARISGMKIRSLRPHFETLDDVYALRNVVAHDAGVVDPATASRVKSVNLAAGASLRISPATLVEKLAPPVMTVAQELDRRIVPG